MERYLLFGWPWSQQVMDEHGVLVEIADENEALTGNNESVWAYPEKNVRSLPPETVENALGRYARITYPDACAHMDDKGVFVDDERNAYVPMEGYDG